MDTKVGSKIRIKIFRGGQVHYESDEIHNVMSASMQTDYSYVFNVYEFQLMFKAATSRIKKQLPGTWKQDDKIISRESGDGYVVRNDLNYYKWENGDEAGFGIKTTASQESIFTVTKSLIKNEGKLYQYELGTSFRYNEGYAINNDIRSPNITLSQTMHRLEWRYDSVLNFQPATLPFILRRISATYKGTGYTSNCFHYDLSDDINIEIGDIITIADWQYNLTFDQITPHEFTICPITKNNWSGRYQDLMIYDKARSSNPEFSNVNKIIFLDTVNKIILRNISNLAIDRISISSLTPKFSVNTNYFYEYPSKINDLIASQKVIFVCKETLTDVKQIIWCSAQTNYAYGIIEYDTPQTFESGKLYVIKTNRQLVNEYD